MDVLIIKGQDIEQLQLYSELVSIGLKINPAKCELLSDAEGDVIQDKLSGMLLKRTAKYVGQVIDPSGNSKVEITDIVFGKIINILKNCKQLTRGARVKLFMIFLISEINHLLPVNSLTGNFRGIWTTIRSKIFKYVLLRQTTPLESMPLMELGFFDIIIKPLMKMMERNLRVTQNEEEDAFLKDAVKNSFKEWLIVEPKYSSRLSE